jgi:hypothetical protein
MLGSKNKSVRLAVEVLIDGLQTDDDYAFEWVRAIAQPFMAAGMDASVAHHAAARFVMDELSTHTFNHPRFPPCADAMRKASATLQALGWEYRHEAWRQPSPALSDDSVVGFDLGKPGDDHTAIATFKREDDGRLTLEKLEHFDEARADIIGQNGNDGEHYAAPAAADFEALVHLRPSEPLAQILERQVLEPAPESMQEPSPEPVTFKTLAEKAEKPAKPAPKSKPFSSPELRRYPSASSKSEYLQAGPKKGEALPDTSGMVDPTGKPSWSNVPEWVQWLGQNKNGVWTGFLAKPEPRRGNWFSTKRWIELNSGETAFAQDFIETLEARP